MEVALIRLELANLNATGIQHNLNACKSSHTSLQGQVDAITKERDTLKAAVATASQQVSDLKGVVTGKDANIAKASKERY